MISITKTTFQEILKTLPDANEAQHNELGSIFDEYSNSVTKNNQLDGTEIDSFLDAVKTKFSELYQIISNYIEGLKASEEVMESATITETNDVTEPDSAVETDNVKKQPPTKDFNIRSDMRTDYEWDDEKFIQAFDRMVARGKDSSTSVLKGKGPVVLRAAREHKIDPRAIIAIIMEESGRGTSGIATEIGNVGGIRRISSGTGKWEDFTKNGNVPIDEAVGDSIMKVGSILDGYYVENNLKTTFSAAKKYCPSGTGHMRSMVISFITQFNNFYFSK